MFNVKKGQEISMLLAAALFMSGSAQTIPVSAREEAATESASAADTSASEEEPGSVNACKSLLNTLYFPSTEGEISFENANYGFTSPSGSDYYVIHDANSGQFPNALTITDEGGSEKLLADSVDYAMNATDRGCYIFRNGTDGNIMFSYIDREGNETEISDMDGSQMLLPTFSANHQCSAAISTEGHLIVFSEGDQSVSDLGETGRNAAVIGVSNDGDKVLWLSDSEAGDEASEDALKETSEAASEDSSTSVDAEGVGSGNFDIWLLQGGENVKIAESLPKGDYFRYISNYSGFFDDGEGYYICDGDNRTVYLSENGKEIRVFHYTEDAQAFVVSGNDAAGYYHLDDGAAPEGTVGNSHVFYIDLKLKDLSDTLYVWDLSKDGDPERIVSGAEAGMFPVGNRIYYVKDNQFCRTDLSNTGEPEVLATGVDSFMNFPDGKRAVLSFTGNESAGESSSLGIINLSDGDYSVKHIADTNKTVDFINSAYIDPVCYLEEEDDAPLGAFSYDNTLWSITEDGETEKLAEHVGVLREDNKIVTTGNPKYGAMYLAQFVSTDVADEALPEEYNADNFITGNVGVIYEGKFVIAASNIALQE